MTSADTSEGEEATAVAMQALEEAVAHHDHDNAAFADHLENGGRSHNHSEARQASTPWIPYCIFF